MTTQVTAVRIPRFEFLIPTTVLTPTFRLRGLGVKMEPLERRVLLSAGDPDLAFGDGGLLVTGASALHVSTSSGAIEDSQGRLLIVGNTQPEEGVAAAWVTRRNADGSVDTTFADNGNAVFGQMHNFTSQSITLQADGKILVTGNIWDENQEDDQTGLGIGVWRLNADGSADTSFGDDGFVGIDLGIGHQLWTYDIAVDANGKIILAGNHQIFDQLERTGMQAMVARFNADGSRDTSFGDNGMVLDDWGGADYEGGRTIKLLADGKILVGGTAGRITPVERAGDGEYVVARYNDDGTLDTTFGGGDGLAKSNFGSGPGGGDVTAMHVNDDGSILTVGNHYPENFTEADYPFKKIADFVKFTADGDIDTSFGANGVKNAQGLDSVSDMEVDSAGNIYLSEYVLGYNPDDPASRTFSVARYDSNGNLDESFGDNGVASQIVEDVNGAVASDLLLTSDGGVIAIGLAHGPDGARDAILAKFLGDDATEPAPQTPDDSTDDEDTETPSDPDDDETETPTDSDSDDTGAETGGGSETSAAVTPDIPTPDFSSTEIGLNFDFDDPTGKKDDLTAEAEESVLPV